MQTLQYPIITEVTEQDRTWLGGLHVCPAGVGGGELDLGDGVLGRGVVHVGREVVLVVVIVLGRGTRLLRHATAPGRTV